MSAREHALKTWPEPFEAVWQGAKTHEIRRDDRGYAVGDTLVLREWDPAPDRCVPSRPTGFTKREIKATVTHKTPGGSWGLPSDLCVMSISIWRESKVPKAAP